MPVKVEDRHLVEEVYRAMNAGPAGEETMMALWAEDAVFIEPFTGQVQTHVGKAAIRASVYHSGRDWLPDMKLMLDRLDLDGDAVRADWTCTTSALPAPMRGYDRYVIRHGKISRLEIIVTEMPGMGPA